MHVEIVARGLGSGVGMRACEAGFDRGEGLGVGGWGWRRGEGAGMR